MEHLFDRKRVPLWEAGSANNGVDPADRPFMDLYLPEKISPGERAGILVIPGGGYGKLLGKEGDPVGQWLAGQGIVSAVLSYRVYPNRFPAPLADAARAMRLFRSMAADLQVDVLKTGVMGFSAGGHLAATLASQPGLVTDPEDQLSGRFDARPSKLILAYPVISFEAFGHMSSAANLLATDQGHLLHQLSNQHFVTARNPPVFLFHTADDPKVPVQNSLMFAEACILQKVPVALHVYPHGPHGTALAAGFPQLSDWPYLMLKWLDDWSDPGFDRPAGNRL